MDEHTLNDLLECSVCLDRLNTSSKVLPCQHTFCRKCLEVIYESRQELRCPECRILVDTKIEDLPPNVLLMRILEGMKNAAATKQTTLPQNETEVKSECIKPSSSSANPINETVQIRQNHNHRHNNNVTHVQHQLQQLPMGAQNQSQPVNQARRSIVPHAYALYDFDSNEPTDLKLSWGLYVSCFFILFA